MKCKLALGAVLVLAAAAISFEGDPLEQVGPLEGGGYLLNSGWRVRPAGTPVEVDTLPMAAVAAPDGRHLVVLNAGYNAPSLSVIDMAEMRELGRVRLPDAWLGLALDAGRERLFVSGGTRAAVYEYGLSGRTLTLKRTLEIVPAAGRTTSDFVGDVALSADGSRLYVALLRRNAVAVVDTASGTVLATWPTGSRPYRILPDWATASVYVSAWAGGAVWRHRETDGTVAERIATGAHPADLLIHDGRLFVAAANTNGVDVFRQGEDGTWIASEKLNVALTPRMPPGMTPSALAVDAERGRLYVVCSDANALAVVDVANAGESRVLGFVPTGWYPTAARVLDGGRVAVLNGKGLRSYPNPRSEYVARIQTGAVTFLDPYSEEELAAWTAQVTRNSPYRDEKLDDAQIPAGNPVPARPGDPAPIRHVVYIVKENRTYDQVLGDLPAGNGQPSLVLFGEDVTPNHHKLAREFVLFDNFYVNADVSAEGHNWSTAAIAPDYVVKLWPNNYGGRGYPYDFEGSDAASKPPSGYLWTRAAEAGLKMANYGYWVNNGTLAATGQIQVSSVRDPVLTPVTNRRFRGFDMDYPDVDRASIFLEDLAQWEAAGECPSLILMRLGNDHTSGTTKGKIAPQAAVADNDLALGQIVEALSRSRFWPQMAVFVVEDDAQNGPDHVDSHRSPAYVLSPYTRRGSVDRSMYNTASMLRTMELLLGLEPLTHFDAGARPMAAAFQHDPDLTPYTAAAPRIPLDTRNAAGAPGAAQSGRMDFREADRIDDDELNGVLWRAIRGSTPPAPVRSRFSLGGSRSSPR